jgi:hypothetical protein
MPTKTTRKSRPSKKVESNGPPPLPDGDILTLVEAAEFLRISEDALKADAIDGKLPSRLVGGEWRFSRGGLLSWLSEWERTPLPPGQVSEQRYSKDHILELAGIWRDDPTVDAMVEEIYRQRKANPVGGV